MNIQERMTAFAMLGAEWVMWLLIALSVIGLAIILERAYYLLAIKENPIRLQAELRKLLRKGDIAEAEKHLASSKSFEARVVGSGLEVATDGAAAVEERMRGETALAKQRMERNLVFLGTVGNNAPFVGLLGTVIGVIRAFQALGDSAGQVTDSLMREIGEALVATAIGILVALPAVAFFNYYQRVIKYRLTWVDALGSDLMAYLKGKDASGTPDPAE